MFSPGRIAFPLLIVLALAGCKSDSNSESAEEIAAVYTLRGEVKSLPSASDAEISIHHEEIPTFVNQKGVETGMPSMSMPFGLIGLDVSELAIGDKIEFKFDVAWKRKPALRILEFKKLPGETALKLEGM
jgi:Cu/Ag efflux protein CusF